MSFELSFVKKIVTKNKDSFEKFAKATAKPKLLENWRLV